jgi:glycosyltransferase involved in cell wall biosynthesis
VARICIDCRYIRERPSGIATLVQALVDYLPRMAQNHRFLFLKHRQGPFRLSSEPNVEERVIRQEANGPATLLYLPSVVDLTGVDLFHATFNILPARLKMPTVVTLCDVMWIKYPQWARQSGLWGFIETVFYRRGIRHALSHATRLAAISETTKCEIGSLDRDAESRTRVTMEGVSSDFRPLAGEPGRLTIEGARARWLPTARRYVLTVGQFAGYKNHERVVRAFARAFADEPGIHLAMIQRLGPGEKTLRPIARDLGVGERVHFLNGVPLSDIVALMNGAIALCHPSLYEGFGNPPAEALACGCPVVTSNRSSMPEVVGDAALLVDPESVDAIAAALRRVALEPDLADEMRQRGYVRARQLSWEKFAAANLAIYREILE